MRVGTTLEFTSDWHIGSGRTSDIADRALRRGSDGLPFVPGKTVTGVIRDEAFRIAEALGGDWPSLAVAVFGERGGRPALVRFRPMFLDSELQALVDSQPLIQKHLTFPRSSVKIDESGVAEEKHLFTTELGRRGTRFTGTADVEPLGDHGFALLALAVRRATRLGGGRRRGLGNCIIDLDLGQELESLDFRELLEEQSPPVPSRPSASSEDSEPEPPAVEDFVDVTVDLVLETPVVALDRTIGNVRTGHTYIPGTMLLGSLVKAAGGWGRLGDLVFNGEVQVRNAYPTTESFRTVPMPLSIVRSKRPEADEPFVNVLEADPPKGAKSQRGKYVASADRGTLVAEQSLTFFTHAVIDPMTQRPTSDVGGVYTYRALPRGSRLQTTMRLPGSLADGLEKVSVDLRLGASKKDDYGQATATFGARLVAKGQEATSTFDLWLLSDALLLNDSLEHDPTVDNLLRVLRMETGRDDIEVDQTFVRSVRREGWSAATDKPRRSLMCLGAGSVVRFKATAGPVESAMLRSLEAVGIGERRAEGFGEVSINSPLLGRQSFPAAKREPADKPEELDEPAEQAVEASDRWLVAVAAEEAVRRITPLVAPKLARHLDPAREGKDQLSKSQLGSLREAAVLYRRDGSAVSSWISRIKRNKNRAKRWGATLGRVDGLVRDPKKVILEAIGNDDHLGEACGAIFELGEQSSEIMRAIVSLFLSEALRHEHLDRSRSG